MFSTYREEKVITSDGNIYLLQYASFTKKEVMEESVKKLSNYLLKIEDSKYYVYVGGSTNLENANKVKNLLENQGIYVYIKNDYIGNNEIVKKINKIDQEIIKSNDNTEILRKNAEILEILKK